MQLILGQPYLPIYLFQLVEHLSSAFHKNHVFGLDVDFEQQAVRKYFLYGQQQFQLTYETYQAI